LQASLHQFSVWGIGPAHHQPLSVVRILIPTKAPQVGFVVY
jgi:hypothetical protein